MARNTEILLRENIKDLGKCGDVVNVSPGYARNFLLPRRLAVEANEENKKLMVRRRARLDVAEAAQNAELDKRVAALQGVVVTTSMRADDHGHLYGSVSAGTIAELLQAAGHSFDEKAVRLDAPIKALGTHAVKVHVHGEHIAEIQVVVEKGAS